MNEHSRAYFEEIGMSASEIDRAMFVMNLCQKTYPGKVETVFINDVISPEGLRQYQNIWVFRNDSISEIKSFMTEITFDYTSTLTPVIMQHKLKDFDLENYSDSSSMHVSINCREDVVMTFRAVRNNCVYLNKIIADRFINQPTK